MPIPLTDWQDNNILILGFAREGESVLKFLREKFPRKKITIWDQASKEKILPDRLEIVNGDSNIQAIFDVGDWLKLSDWDNFDVIIKSAGIPVKNLPKTILSKLTSETEMFFDLCPGVIVGITGTKGKSTTSSLIYDILKAAGKKVVLLGNIGKPALDYLADGDKKTTFVFELSSHQLQTLKKSPHIAVLLNIFPEHLDFYENFADYINAKANITKFQSENDYLIFNSDDQQTKKIADSSSAKLNPLGQDDLILARELSQGSKLLGEFNLSNIAAAVKVTELFQVSKTITKKAIKDFQPLEHRLEPVGTYQGITFYNDSLATIPEATIAALDTLGDDVETIFLGGFDRGVDYQSLVKRLRQSQVHNLILFPTTGSKIWDTIMSQDPTAARRFKHFSVQNMADGVKLAYQYTTKGKIALLSCASTSFNLFKDYRDRGDQFKKYVQQFGQK